MWKDVISIRRDTWMRKSNVYSDRRCEMIKCWQKVFGSWTLQGDFVMEIRLHVATALSTHIHIFTDNNTNKCDCVCVSLLQRHWGTRPEPKPWIKFFSECRIEGVEVDQWVRDSVEGQSASRTVHIHCYSVRDRGGGEGEGFFSLIVTDRVTTIIRAVQTPGLIIQSKPMVITVSSPPDSSVTHWYTNASFPLDLPVTATSQIISTQQLPEVKPLWMIRIWLLLSHVCHLLVVVRQFELSVYSVCVHCEFTDIWWREQDTIQQQFII